jgi:hypothetical protein
VGNQKHVSSEKIPLKSFLSVGQRTVEIRGTCLPLQSRVPRHLKSIFFIPQKWILNTLTAFLSLLAETPFTVLRRGSILRLQFMPEDPIGTTHTFLTKPALGSTDTNLP